MAIFSVSGILLEARYGAAFCRYVLEKYLQEKYSPKYEILKETMQHENGTGMWLPHYNYYPYYSDVS